ncbi:MAG: FtsX-like permease family protein [Bacillota bacterium]|nr:FtsX-like permease family protein [Bacillota bacterium]
MKPLSIFNYGRNNKKKLVSSVIAVTVAVVFLYVINTFVKSMTISMHRLNISCYEKQSRINAFDKENPIPEEFIKSVKENSAVDKVIPYTSSGIKYSIPGSVTSGEIIALRSQDTDYFLSRQGINLTEGRLPEEGKMEVAIDSLVAKNKKLKLGDSIGSSVNKFDEINGEYKVVGILEGDNMLSIAAANNTTFPDYKDEARITTRRLIVFPAAGKLDEVNKVLEALPEDKVTVRTRSLMQEEFDRMAGVVKILDIVCILAIVLMVITVGSSKYVQYFNRKEELGILSAIGYSKRKLLGISAAEVFAVNTASYLIGLALALGLSALIKNSFEAMGAEGVVFDLKALIISLYLPLFTTLFTVIPVNLMINKLDPINMVESN